MTDEQDTATDADQGPVPVPIAGLPCRPPMDASGASLGTYQVAHVSDL